MHRVHTRLDLNLLVALDALLEECSVTRAAERLGITEPAMSRALGRIRRAVGDPVLVRAGHAMQPTPHAVAVRAEVHALVQRARAVLAPAAGPALETLERTFTVVANDAVVTSVGDHLVSRLEARAPGVTVRFLAQLAGEGSRLREGVTDLEIGVLRSTAPEIRTEHLGRDRHVLAMRADNPLAEGELTVERIAAARHLQTSRHGRTGHPLDDALAETGHRRRVSATAPTYAATLLLLMGSRSFVSVIPWLHHRHTVETLGLTVRELPFALPPVNLSQAWHPRDDADPAHRWLRAQVREAVGTVLGPRDAQTSGSARSSAGRGPGADSVSR
ncbi:MULTISPECIES: LysR family transcriptional regulator [Streptomyces]|uniref:LysR family transcriptional regulator n=1 Tax=Streptomyces TaxID=1883 RepID=UPI00163C940A|nr:MULTISPECIES: LysR family transcriptional regulator [Streptomyces]MBC2877970.1 LysR family transcriptional regulator [Streptomyces sp. TYQ1024]UBI39931.1 LysR family transcriptional regulator [Streptomyces mobaraensis]UKW32511.1 LysR family transcriptional regulator [Streptomyces sp. TYQ1024]